MKLYRSSFVRGCSQGAPKEGFVMGSRSQGFQEILKIWDVLTPTSLNCGMGHMEPGHRELFCIATVLQITSRMVI